MLGNWTAPDAYAGNVGDPMSQKAYMWDGNNSFLYEDPSGYDAVYVNYFVAKVILGIKFYHTFVTVRNNAGKTIATYSFGPSPGNVFENVYLNKDYALKDPATLHPEESVLVQQCKGVCNSEAGMKEFNSAWKNNTVPYDATGKFRPNSNSMSHATLDSGGIGISAPPGAPGYVWGWNWNGSAIITLMNTLGPFAY